MLRQAMYLGFLMCTITLALGRSIIRTETSVTTDGPGNLMTLPVHREGIGHTEHQPTSADIDPQDRITTTVDPNALYTTAPDEVFQFDKIERTRNSDVDVPQRGRRSTTHHDVKKLRRFHSLHQERVDSLFNICCKLPAVLDVLSETGLTCDSYAAALPQLPLPLVTHLNDITILENLTNLGIEVDIHKQVLEFMGRLERNQTIVNETHVEVVMAMEEALLASQRFQNFVDHMTFTHTERLPKLSTIGFQPATNERKYLHILPGIRQIQLRSRMVGHIVEGLSY